MVAHSGRSPLTNTWVPMRLMANNRPTKALPPTAGTARKPRAAPARIVPRERVDVDAGRTSRSARRLGTRPSIAPAATMSSGYRSFSNPRPKPPIWSVSIAKRTAIGARSRPSDVFDDAVVSFVVVMGYPSLRATAWLEQLRDLWCRYNRFGPIRGRSHPSECSIQLRMLNTRSRADVTAVMGALQREV